MTNHHQYTPWKNIQRYGVTNRSLIKTSWLRVVAPLSLALAVSLAPLLSGDALAAPPTDEAAQAAAAVEAAAAAAATLGLSSLKEMAANNNHASLGFASAAEVSKAKLGGPFSVYMIQYDELSSLDPNADPKTALHDLNQRLFPVYVNGSVRSAIVVQQTGSGTWSVASVGNAALAKLLDGAKKANAKSNGPKEYMLIRVPALYQMFLAHTDGGGKLHFITVREDKALGSAKSGKSRPARTVLDLLSALAKSTQPLKKP